MADNDDNKRGRWQGFDFGGGSGGGGGDRRRWRFTLAYVLLGIAALWVLQLAFVPQPEKIKYSQFLDRVEAGEVQSVAISETGIEGDSTNDSDNAVDFVTTRVPALEDQDLDDCLRENDVEFDGEVASAFSNFIFSWILPIVILVAIWGFVFRRMAGGGASGALNLGKRGVKIYDRKDLKTTFDDVAGVDEAVEELE